MPHCTVCMMLDCVTHWMHCWETLTGAFAFALPPGLARKLAWLAYTTVHTPQHMPQLGAPRPTQPSSLPEDSLSKWQAHLVHWLLPSSGSSWHVALAIAWVVIFALTCYGTHGYTCTHVRVLLALSFLVAGAHVGSAVLGWLVRMRRQQLLLLLPGAAAAKSSSAAAASTADVELGRRLGRQPTAAAAAVSGQCSSGVEGGGEGACCADDFEEPCGVQPQVVQLVGLGLLKTKSQ